jgi:RNA polymerase sigma-70 factor (TIGR02957 family)
MMDEAIRAFDRLRPRLQGLAYRMLGTVADAEDVVQDAWLRWREADTGNVESAEAWLVTVTTRLAIDRLRRAKLERAHYVGLWLPEPWVDPTTPLMAAAVEAPPTPEALLERADDVSMAFLTLLERLGPEARAAFLLREVFDADYTDVARALGKSEAACRQIVSRAKRQVRSGDTRQAVAPEIHYRLLAGFAAAARTGDFAALQHLLAEDAEVISDGGGIVPSFGKIVTGADRIARLYFAIWRRSERGDAVQRLALARFNGQWGLLRFIDGRFESAQTLDTDGQRITRIHTQRNPHKLRRLAAAWAQAQGVVTNAGA